MKEGESVRVLDFSKAQVEFDVTDGQKGKVATNVTAPGGVAFNRVLV